MEPILIAEDEAPIRDLIRLTLEGAGYDCVCAADGDEAADRIEERDFALAVLDIMLPRIDGYELLRYLQSTGTPARNATPARWICTSSGCAKSWAGAGRSARCSGWGTNCSGRRTCPPGRRSHEVCRQTGPGADAAAGGAVDGVQHLDPGPAGSDAAPWPGLCWRPPCSAWRWRRPAGLPPGTPR